MAPLSVEELERFVKDALQAKVGQGGGNKKFPTRKKGGVEVVVGEGVREDLYRW